MRDCLETRKNAVATQKYISLWNTNNKHIGVRGVFMSFLGFGKENQIKR
jgi:hypothetical protein